MDTRFSRFRERLSKFAPLIDREMKRMIPVGRFPNLYDGMGYAVSAGGKRMRPTLCLMVCEALGGDVDEALPVAVAIEVLHNATLVHDDIEDGDETRRGMPSVWKKYGVPHATNIGDLMIFKSYESIFNSSLSDGMKADIAGRFTQVLVELTEGQNMEFNFRERDDVSVGEYLEMANKKAGILIGFSMAAGARVAGAPMKLVSFLQKFGSEIGLAFMIRDDVLNIIGDEGKYGKEIGGDIKEGKRTLMMVDCLNKCSEMQRDSIMEILGKPRGEVTDDEVEFVVRIFQRHGSIKFAQDHSRKLVDDAIRSLRGLEDGELKSMLAAFGEFMIKRES